MAELEDLENFHSDRPNVLVLYSDLVREEHHESQHNNIPVGLLRKYKAFLLPYLGCLGDNRGDLQPQ